MALSPTAEVALDEAAVAGVPNRPAVYLIHLRQGDPYLARTGVLRRRLLRLSRMPKLRDNAKRVEYWLTGSTLESQTRMYHLARHWFPRQYLELMHLRMPPYIKLLLGNQYPRSSVTTQMSRPSALYFGPFRSRASAEHWEARFLDLFQVRRCQDDLTPSPEHPGCVYGEMGMCLRPCQAQVTPEEYRSEVRRATDFLLTGGKSLLDAALRQRERASAEMDFEEARRQHKRIERIEEVQRELDPMARAVEQLHGVAVTGSSAPEAVELSLVRAGQWLGTRRLTLESAEGKTVSLDQRIRELLSGFGDVERPAREQAEYLAILARWFHSSWRDGELILFDDPARPPIRKLAGAVSRVYRGVV